MRATPTPSFNCKSRRWRQHGRRRTLGRVAAYPVAGRITRQSGRSTRSSSSSRTVSRFRARLATSRLKVECLEALVEAYRQRGDMIGVARRQSELLQLEERLRQPARCGEVGRSGWGRR